MKTNYKTLIFLVVITILIGSIPSFFVDNDVTNLIKPFLAPPAFIFPIVWTILYVLMGISLYIVYEEIKKLSNIYLLQLLINSIWPVIFFGLKWRLVAFLVLVLLFIFVILMIINFYKIKKIAGYLNLPYLFWIVFASYLNLSYYFLN